MLLFTLSLWLCVAGVWVGAGFDGRGSWLGCGYSRLLGCSCYLVLGSAAPAPGFLGTQPPCATQALTAFTSLGRLYNDPGLLNAKVYIKKDKSKRPLHLITTLLLKNLRLSTLIFSSRKYPYIPPQKGLEGGGFCKIKKLKKCMKFNWNFHSYWWERVPFCGRGMDISWNYTMSCL